MINRGWMRCSERWRESYPEGGQAELQYSAGQFKVHLQLFGGLHHRHISWSVSLIIGHCGKFLAYSCFIQALNLI